MPEFVTFDYGSQTGARGAADDMHPLASKVARSCIAYYAERPADHGRMGSLTHALLCLVRDISLNRTIQLSPLNVALVEWINAGCPVFNRDEVRSTNGPSRLEVLMDPERDQVELEGIFGKEEIEDSMRPVVVFETLDALQGTLDELSDVLDGKTR